MVWGGGTGVTPFIIARGDTDPSDATAPRMAWRAVRNNISTLAYLI